MWSSFIIVGDSIISLSILIWLTGYRCIALPISVGIAVLWSTTVTYVLDQSWEDMGFIAAYSGAGGGVGWWLAGRKIRKKRYLTGSHVGHDSIPTDHDI